MHVLGVALADAAQRRDDVRLEELAYRTARAALDDAGVRRDELDNITLGASDELDGRPISSMLLAAPSGGYLKDEIRVTNSGATALGLAVARHLSGDFGLGLVASWCKPSKTDVPTVMNSRWEPFFHRDLGLDAAVAEGLFAQAVSAAHDLQEDELHQRTHDAMRRARENPRAVERPVASPEEIASSGHVSTPVRSRHVAEQSDGAACLVLASDAWMAGHPEHRAIATIPGVGWSTDSYRLDRERLGATASATAAWAAALRMAGGDAPVDVVELETPTIFHEAALTRVLPIGVARVSPSGGTFAQNPLTAAGLVGVVEAVLQVSGRAGPVQVPDVRRAVAHSSNGFAHQGSVVTVVDAAERLAA